MLFGFIRPLLAQHPKLLLGSHHWNCPRQKEEYEETSLWADEVPCPP